MSSRLQLDAQSFEKLLAAAFVVQQQRDRLRVHLASDDTNRISAIADAQITVQRQKLSPFETMELVVQRAWDLTQGTGTAIWSRQGEDLVCKAVAGNSSAKTGERTPLAANLLASCFRSGEIFLCENTSLDPRATFEALPQPAGGSLIAVPIHHESQVEAALEVFFAKPRGWHEIDVRTCQLLAGIVSEAMARGAEQEWRETVAAERATMLAALERIQPHLNKLLGEASPEHAPASGPVAPPVTSEERRGLARLGQFLLSEQEKKAAALSSSAETDPDDDTEESPPIEAWRLPHELLQESTPLAETSGREVQTALNLALHSPSKPHPSGSIYETEEGNVFDSADGTQAEPQGADNTSLVHDPRSQSYSAQPASGHEPEAEIWDLEAEPFESPEPGLTPLQRFWNSHWADFCLAVSATLLLGALLWAFWPAPPGSAAAKAGGLSVVRPKAPQLTPLEHMLVALGLADEPPRPVLAGNPNVQVWVDLHTALYYCPGTPAYGTTRKGRFLLQKDAQLEQFEAAARQPCQ